ncbi:MAG: hypothetical protein JST92_15890, partial [Deltaproteobacteria bacterium]|nr:hypothetical protein [Deltaproteobacteria bacterium]
MAKRDRVEERDTTLDDLKTGVTLRAGHPVILLVGGHGHPAQPDDDGDEGTGATAAPQDPTGEAPSGDGPGEEGGGGTHDEGHDDEGGATAPAPQMGDEIDFQLVSQAGKPRPGVEFEITVPDGSKRAGKSDAEGKVHFGALTDGDCVISLPDVRALPDAKAQDGRVAYADGMKVPVNKPTVIELPPGTHRARLSGAHFETAKTFLLPSAMAGIRELRELYDTLGGGMSVLSSGHTDTV